MRGRHWACTTIASALLVAGCAGHRHGVPVAARPAPAPVVATTATDPAGDGDGLAPGTDSKALATIWHLRVALNVAALACRGSEGDALVAGYNAMLRNRRALLAAAQAALVAQYRGSAARGSYDSAMTRLYNLYARPAGQPQFCKTAVRIQRAERDVPAAHYADFSADAVVALNQPFAHLPTTSSVAAIRRPAPRHAAKRRH